MLAIQRRSPEAFICQEKSEHVKKARIVLAIPKNIVPSHYGFVNYSKCDSPHIVVIYIVSIDIGNRSVKGVLSHPRNEKPCKLDNALDCLNGGIGMSGLTNIYLYPSIDK